MDNINHLASNPNFKFVEHDVTLPFKDTVDQIFNLACPASPLHYQQSPIQTTKVCVQGAINMLDLATQANCTIFQASTSEIYGDPDVHPQPESYWGKVNPVGPRTCYNEGKRCAESSFYDYRRQHGTKIKVVRIFNTYGPRMHVNDGRVVASFVVQALRGHSLIIYGSGFQTRSFCYVSDLIDGIIRLVNAPADLSGPVNLGNPEEFTIRALAHSIIEMTGSRSEIVFKAAAEDDPKFR
jgi:UDP-glucuronate decarboxylase